MKRRIMFKLFEEYLKASWCVEMASGNKEKMKADRRERALRKILKRNKNIKLLQLNDFEIDEINDSIKQIANDEFKDVE